MVWSGLGLNYKADETNWDSDIAYFRSIGLTKLRMHLPAVESPWSAGTNNGNGNNAYWRECSKYFADRGFEVTWGLALLHPVYDDGTMTLTNWNSYAACVLAEATYLISQGIRLWCFEISNEIDSKVDGSTLTADSLITNQKALATSIKALSGWTALGTKVGVAMYDHNGVTYDKWIAAGRGAMDILALHPYGNVHNSGKSLSMGGYSALQKMFTAFGTNAIVDEFNLDAGYPNILTIPDETQVNRLRERYALIKSIGFTRADFYTWVGYLNVNDDFALKQNSGDFRSMWDVLLTDNKRRTFVN